MNHLDSTTAKDPQACRLAALRGKLQEQQLEALVVTHGANRLYLSGFTGTSGVLVITQEKAILITDFRYTEQAKEEAPLFTIIETKGKISETLAQVLDEAESGRVGFEAGNLTVKQFTDWQKAMPNLHWEATEGLVEGLRQTKDEKEVAAIQQALSISEATLMDLLPRLKPGLTEMEVATDLEFGMRRRGGVRASFETIVASGPRGAYPHGTATSRVIGRDEFVTLDFGTVYRNYCSDLTRTIFLGSPTPEHRKVYQVVLEAQEKAIAAVRPGVTGAELDQVARRHIEEAGYGQYFGHGLGHGVGLEIHEGPRVGPNSQDVLQPGMVITVEPGIYIPGWGGVRIEDMVLVTDRGGEVLTRAPKELLAL